MWRFLPLAAVLLAAAAFSRPAWRGLTLRDAGRQIAVGALSQSGYMLGVFYAVQLGVSSGTTALIDGVQPLVAGALAGPLLRQYVSRRQWLGLWLGLAGVATVTLADAGAAGADVPWWAYFVPFLGMLSLVAATFLERRSCAPVPPRVSMTIHCTTSAVLFAVGGLARNRRPARRLLVLAGDRLARGAAHLRRLRPVLADPAPVRHHRGQHPHVPHGPGHGGVGCPHVRRALRGPDRPRPRRPASPPWSSSGAGTGRTGRGGPRGSRGPARTVRRSRGRRRTGADARRVPQKPPPKSPPPPPKPSPPPKSPPPKPPPKSPGSKSPPETSPPS